MLYGLAIDVGTSRITCSLLNLTNGEREANMSVENPQIAYGDTDMAVGADQSKKPILTLADEESIPMPMPQNGF
jgi:uncharacterized 2Fe-2S/4Fe-4S cluster protein (DUF4445 family)